MGILPVAFVFVLALIGKATVTEFIEMTKWIFLTLGLGGAAPAILGRALEGYAEKRDVAPAPILAGSIGKIDTVPPPARQRETLQAPLERLPSFDDDDEERLP